MIRVEAILFDLDGTLIDSKRDLVQSVQHLQSLYHVPVAREERVASFIGDGVVTLVQRALPGLLPDQLEEAVLQFKRYYHDHCVEHTRVYPGVLEALRHFKDKKLAVVTNKPVRVSGYILDQLGLTPFFKVLIGGDSLPNKKPHPEPVMSAMATLVISDAKKVVMVGDSPNDVESGRDAGTHTCGLQSNIGDPQKLLNSRPDFLISEMTELTRLFQ